MINLSDRPVWLCDVSLSYVTYSMEDVNKPDKIFFLFLNLGGGLRNSDPEEFAYTGCKENHFYGLPFGQAEASVY